MGGKTYGEWGKQCMIKIFRHGKMNDTPIKKFRCSCCCCGFKTDEYKKQITIDKVIRFVAKCPECNMLCFRY